MKPGIEAVTMFRNVQLRVKQTIGQDPWLSFPSLPALYFAGSKPPENLELTFWTSVRDSANPTEFRRTKVRLTRQALLTTSLLTQA
jgi:hypothetical protein